MAWRRVGQKFCPQEEFEDSLALFGAFGGFNCKALNSSTWLCSKLWPVETLLLASHSVEEQVKVKAGDRIQDSIEGSGHASLF